jgi:hypothetical protein
MALRGEAAVVIWGEMSADAAAVGLWYAREHLSERLSIPGFLEPSGSGLGRQNSFGASASCLPPRVDLAP